MEAFKAWINRLKLLCGSAKGEYFEGNHKRNNK